LESNQIYYVKGEKRCLNKMSSTNEVPLDILQSQHMKGYKKFKISTEQCSFFIIHVLQAFDEEKYSSIQNWFFFLPGLKIFYDTEHLVLKFKIIWKWLHALLKQFRLNAVVVLPMISTFYKSCYKSLDFASLQKITIDLNRLFYEKINVHIWGSLTQ
jgi:hypothetical protein